MRTYRNVVLDFLQYFLEYKFSVIPRDQNEIVDALSTSASTFKIPSHQNKRYETEVKHRPIVPDNIIYWQVIENDKHL